MKKQRLFSLFLACAAGGAPAAILWQDPQEAYTAGYSHYANADYIQALPHEAQAAAKLGQLWGLLRKEAGEVLASPQWRSWQRVEQMYREGKNDGCARYWYERGVAGGENPLLTAMSLDDLRALATLRGDTAQAQTWRDRAISAWRPLATTGDLYAQSRQGELLLQRGQAIDLPQARE